MGQNNYIFGKVSVSLFSVFFSRHTTQTRRAGWLSSTTSMSTTKKSMCRSRRSYLKELATNTSSSSSRSSTSSSMWVLASVDVDRSLTLFYAKQIEDCVELKKTNHNPLSLFHFSSVWSLLSSPCVSSSTATCMRTNTFSAKSNTAVKTHITSPPKKDWKNQNTVWNEAACSESFNILSLRIFWNSTDFTLITLFIFAGGSSFSVATCQTINGRQTK